MAALGDPNRVLVFRCIWLFSFSFASSSFDSGLAARAGRICTEAVEIVENKANMECKVDLDLEPPRRIAGSRSLHKTAQRLLPDNLLQILKGDSENERIESYFEALQ